MSMKSPASPIIALPIAAKGIARIRLRRAESAVERMALSTALKAEDATLTSPCAP